MNEFYITSPSTHLNSIGPKPSTTTTTTDNTTTGIAAAAAVTPESRVTRTMLNLVSIELSVSAGNEMLVSAKAREVMIDD